MKDSLLTNKQKKEICILAEEKDYPTIIAILDKVSTKHAGSAKMKDKRFVIGEIVSSINKKTKEKSANAKAKEFFITGKKLCSTGNINAIEIGANIIWRGYEHNKPLVKNILQEIADHENWEVREWVSGPLENLLRNYSEFYSVMQKWSKYKSANVRRAVVLASMGLYDPKKPENVFKAFKLLKPLLYDNAVYVKKNLGPFMLGGWWGRHYPKEFFRQLDKWIKLRNENVRWNIAMCFNNSTGNLYPHEAIRYLKILRNDNNPSVQRAVKSTYRFLLKRNTDLKL